MPDRRPGRYGGLDAYKRYLEQWIESFDGLRTEVEEYIGVGDDRVFTLSPRHPEPWDVPIPPLIVEVAA